MRRLTAWALVAPDGSDFELRRYDPRGEEYYDFKAVRLVEHSPSADAVVRAAVKYFAAPQGRAVPAYLKLDAAVERHLQRKGSKP